MAASPESSPGGTSAQKKPGAGAAVGADSAIDGKEAGNAKGAAGYRPFRTPDLHKWAVEPSGHGLPDELQLIDLTPTPRRALTIIGEQWCLLRSGWQFPTISFLLTIPFLIDGAHYPKISGRACLVLHCVCVVYFPRPCNCGLGVALSFFS